MLKKCLLFFSLPHTLIHTFENVNFGLSGMKMRIVAETKLGKPHNSK